jgi:hypothetical protein
MWANSVFFLKLPKARNCPTGENSPYLVTLIAFGPGLSCEVFRVEVSQKIPKGHFTNFQEPPNLFSKTFSSRQDKSAIVE